MMDIVILVVGMILVGLIMGFVAGLIWKDNRPYGATGDYLISTLVAVIVGLIDWYVIPAIGFSNLTRDISVVFEPASLALIVLWLVRVAKR
jgi:uncharacterized membrane protein YeaQ/YmgE (transglycosylase-associated protein family)